MGRSRPIVKPASDFLETDIAQFLHCQFDLPFTQWRRTRHAIDLDNRHRQRRYIQPCVITRQFRTRCLKQSKTIERIQPPDLNVPSQAVSNVETLLR